MRDAALAEFAEPGDLEQLSALQQQVQDYLRELAPAVYGLFGIDATYDYLAESLGTDPAPVIGAGTSSDDWLGRLGKVFSLVCELPYYTAPGLEDTRPAGCTRRGAVLTGLARVEAIHAECARSFTGLDPPDHRLTRSVADYVAKTPKRLAAERAHAGTPAYAREATRAEALDATVCRIFYHMLYLGEVYRLAEMVGKHTLAESLRGRVAELAAEIECASALRVLPLRRLVAVQAGAGLLALAQA